MVERISVYVHVSRHSFGRGNQGLDFGVTLRSADIDGYIPTIGGGFIVSRTFYYCTQGYAKANWKLRRVDIDRINNTEDNIERIL